MGYIPAKEVTSPKANLKLVLVVSDPGPSVDGKYVESHALGFWDDAPVVLSRWNGTDTTPVGNPQSRGLPTWYVQGSFTEMFAAELGKLAPQHAEWIRGFLALQPITTR